MIVHCPHCRTPCRYDESNPQRPFCSERCRLIDLGAWADESNRIPGEDASLDEQAGPGELPVRH